MKSRSASCRTGWYSSMIWLTAAALQPLPAQVMIAGQPVELTVGWVGAERHGLVRVLVEPIVGGAPQRMQDGSFVLPQSWLGEPLRLRERGEPRTLRRGALRLTAD